MCEHSASCDARAMHRGRYSAWLTKKKQAGLKWISTSVRRYFTLDFESRTVSYTKTNNSKGGSSCSIRFEEILGAEQLPNLKNQRSTGDHSFGFTLRTLERIYHLYTFTFLDAAHWVDGLNAASILADVSTRSSATASCYMSSAAGGSSRPLSPSDSASSTTAEGSEKDSFCNVGHSRSNPRSEKVGTSIFSSAVASPESPGEYTLQTWATVTTGHSKDSDVVVEHLPFGSQVTVVEVVHIHYEKRVRGRIADPQGYITLRHMTSGERYAVPTSEAWMCTANARKRREKELGLDSLRPSTSEPQQQDPFAALDALMEMAGTAVQQPEPEQSTLVASKPKVAEPAAQERLLHEARLLVTRQVKRPPRSAQQSEWRASNTSAGYPVPMADGEPKEPLARRPTAGRGVHAVIAASSALSEATSAHNPDADSWDSDDDDDAPAAESIPEGGVQGHHQVTPSSPHSPESAEREPCALRSSPSGGQIPRGWGTCVDEEDPRMAGQCPGSRATTPAVVLKPEEPWNAATSSGHMPRGWDSDDEEAKDSEQPSSLGATRAIQEGPVAADSAACTSPSGWDSEDDHPIVLNRTRAAADAALLPPAAATAGLSTSPVGPSGWDSEDEDDESICDNNLKGTVSTAEETVPQTTDCPIQNQGWDSDEACGAASSTFSNRDLRSRRHREDRQSQETTQASDVLSAKACGAPVRSLVSQAVVIEPSAPSSRKQDKTDKEPAAKDEELLDDILGEVLAVDTSDATATAGGSSSSQHEMVPSLHCTQCDHQVMRVFEHLWTPEVDYMFCRNFYPNASKLRKQMRPRKGGTAYCCQCSWKSARGAVELTDVAEGLRWRVIAK